MFKREDWCKKVNFVHSMHTWEDLWKHVSGKHAMYQRTIEPPGVTIFWNGNGLIDCIVSSWQVEYMIKFILMELIIISMSYVEKWNTAITISQDSGTRFGFNLIAVKEVYALVLMIVLKSYAASVSSRFKSVSVLSKIKQHLNKV